MANPTTDTDPDNPKARALQQRIAHCASASRLAHRHVSELAQLKSPQHFGLLFRGQIKAPHADTMERLAEVFGVRPSWLLYGEGETPSREAIYAATATARAEAKDRPGPGVTDDEDDEDVEPEAEVA